MVATRLREPPLQGAARPGFALAPAHAEHSAHPEYEHYTPQMSNRLAAEKSPYLLQHANNPVDWYPWGEEAFAKAHAADKPIFLSIGYSTCHWCHVMEHESFENQEIADALNRDFVSIKVDREERPDVDRVYMAFVQATTGAGGWPMSVWLTPGLHPFYGGTYFPPTSRWQRPGFIDVLREIARAWRSERDKVLHSAAGIVDRLRAAERQEGGTDVPDASALERTVAEFRTAYDSRRGGFGDAPKFPRPSELLFLFREFARTGEAMPRDMALHTLRAMALGGLRDHVGGGFHRYSVDGDWRVPHFEKMLYDQAQLALAYVEAAQITGDAFYGATAADTLAYVQREMTDSAGGFYSAEDADSVPPELASEAAPHKREGAFYVWSADEVRSVLGDDAPVFASRFGVEPGGNAPSDPQEEFTGRNLLYTARSLDEVAEATGRTTDDVRAALARARLALFTARLARPKPHLDDKVIAAWNGWMIGAFARAARVLRVEVLGGGAEPARSYLDSATRAASFVRQALWDADRRVLRRRYRAGEAAIDGYAEDYAAVIFGSLELFQAGGDPRWLEWAIELQRRQDELFWDDEAGGWFSTAGTDPSVLVRMKEDYDGAEPAASSVSVLNLLTLSHLAGDTGEESRIRRTLGLFSDRLAKYGRVVPLMSAALSTWYAGLSQVVIVGSDPDDASPMFDVLARLYRPFAIVIPIDPDRDTSTVSSLLPFTGPMVAGGPRPSAWVCRNFTCERPVETAEALANAVDAG